MIHVFHLLVLYVYKFQVESVSLNFKNISFVHFNNISPRFYPSKSTSSDTADFNATESPSIERIDKQFFNISDKTNNNSKNKENFDKIKWASFEARRFTYKLARFNKKLRKVKNKRKLIYSNFDVDENELKKINLESRDINKSIQTFRALRKSFLKFLRGLRLNNNPAVPYVPETLRSDKIPNTYYQLSDKPSKSRPKRTIKDKESKNLSNINRDKSGVEKKVKKNDEYVDFLKILSEIKGKRYYKGKIIG